MYFRYRLRGGGLKGTTEVIISPHSAVCYGSYENGTFAFLTTGVNPKTFAKYSTLLLICQIFSSVFIRVLVKLDTKYCSKGDITRQVECKITRIISSS